MPITQDRMISLIEIATALLEQAETIRKYGGRGMMDIPGMLEALAEEEDKARCRLIVDKIKAELNIIFNTIVDMPISIEAVKILEREKTHFKLSGKRNLKAAQSMEMRRMILNAREGREGSKRSSNPRSGGRTEQKSKEADYDSESESEIEVKPFADPEVLAMLDAKQLSEDKKVAKEIYNKSGYDSYVEFMNNNGWHKEIEREEDMKGETETETETQTQPPNNPPTELIYAEPTELDTLENVPPMGKAFF
jgi:hypothetical protein